MTISHSHQDDDCSEPGVRSSPIQTNDMMDCEMVQNDFESGIIDINVLSGKLEKLRSHITPESFQLIERFIESIEKPFPSLQKVLQTQKNYFDLIIALDELQLDLVNKLNSAKKNVNVLVHQSNANLSKQENPEIHWNDFSEVLMEERELRKILQKYLNQRAAEVVKLCLSKEAEFRESFFHGVELTEKNISKRYHLLAQFHPEQFPQCSKNDVFIHFLKILDEEEEIALLRLQQVVGSSEPERYIDFHISKAEEYLALIIDWQNVSKGQFDRLRILKREDYHDKTLQEQLDFQKDNAQLCYQQYRAACKIADAIAIQNQGSSKFTHYRHRQVEIRKHIATILRAADNLFESQMYTFGALRIFLQCDDATDSEFMEIYRNVSKIESPTPANALVQSETIINNRRNLQRKPPIQSQALSLYYDNQSLVLCNERLPAISTYSGRHRRRQFVRREIAKLALQELSSLQARLASYTTPNEEITRIHTNSEAVSYRKKGTLVIGAGISLVLLSFAVASSIISKVVKSRSVPGTRVDPAGIFFNSIGNIFFGVIGIFNGYCCLQKGMQLLREPKIRENLSKLIGDAIELYHQEKYDEFLETLSSNYNESKETDSRLFRYKKGKSIKIRPIEFIDDLLHHNFRPDDIAYLLIILGETLISNTIKFTNDPASSLEEKASTIFETIFTSLKLKEAAKALDIAFKGYSLRKLPKDQYLNRSSHESMSNKYRIDGKETCCTNHLQELIVVARLNYALLQVVIGQEDNLDLAKDQLIELYSITSKHCQFFSISQKRLSTIEDFLSALGFDPSITLNKDRPNQNLV
ncbi:hypothetical protein TrispH2_011569 [Trichoplax sp. H2]|nr:hypothetical protein TrispH2_011569 [Trichoplax sp. H2]|eukprot:RDD36427.1 hypothetical protein TrispH2_011569 [Trichoplax sp. H2]